MNGGWFPAPEAIVVDLGPAPAVLYGRIWRYCQGGGTCYASLATLAKECGVGESTVKRWIAKLVEGGYITADSGKARGTTGTLTTTRKWVMGGGEVSSEKVGQDELPRRPGRPTRVVQNDPRLKEAEEKREDRNPNDIAPNVTARGVAQRATPTSKSKAQRQPKPLFDAFKAAFPAANPSLAGRFDSTCVGRGFTVDLWHAFMATADARKDYLRGTLTMGNALNRFVAWCDDQAPARPATDKPLGAPDNWRSLVYSYDGTKLWPALALPRMGLDPHAPPSSWPAWYRAFEGVAA